MPPLPAACNKAASTTVTITPPAFEKITVTAAPASDEVCSGTGKLVFNVTTSKELTAAQIQGATSSVNGTASSASQTCTGTGTGTAFTLECAGLATDSYTLFISIPNAQYPSEWRPKSSGCLLVRWPAWF
jgi:hypothetical protein